MSSAVLRIQVATLSDAPDGQSRIDGVPNQLVTASSRGAGSTHELAFWDVANPGVSGSSTTAPVVPTLTPIGNGRTWTFTPPGGANGYGQSFGLQLIVDRGLPTEARSRRKYAIPTQIQQLILPLFGEGADREASLSNSGQAQVANSADNAGGNWRGFAARLLRWLAAFDLFAGRLYVSPSPQSPPGGQPTTTPVHVGTVFLQGGTLADVSGDIGDFVNAAEPTQVTVRLQSNASILAQYTVTQLRSWVAHPLSAAIPAGGAAYEVFLNSQNTTGSWACRGLQFSVRMP